MCFFGGGGSVQSGPRMTTVDVTDPTTGAVNQVQVEEGVPADYAARGATTIAQYQQMSASDLSDKQIAANKEISDRQIALNERQFAEQQAQFAQQQAQTEEQAGRQSAYDTGRSQALQEGTSRIDQAFSRFTPAYFDQYKQDYLAKAQDQIDLQRRQATKNLGFQLARQGLTASQAGVNERGLLDETAGRATAEQAGLAAQSADTLRSNTANARQALLDQTVAAQSIGSPIAGSTIQDVNAALQTQRNAVSGVTSNAGDVVASLAAVPVVNQLSDIFGRVLGGAGAAFQGFQAGDIRSAVNRGLRGTDPN